MKTFEEIEQLKQSRFGRPQPRHGLKLLYWFVNDCLILDQNNALQLRCYPGNGDFGFHLFANRYERNGEKLLPDVTFCYYVVGNLSKGRVNDLPLYVREHYTGYKDISNKDRIIVGMKNKWFQTLFVTEHIDRSNFNKHATFQISKRLIKIIRDLSLDAFLLMTGYSTVQANRFSIIPVNIPTYNSPAQYTAPSTITMTSRNQHSDIEAAPVSQRNTDVKVIIDDTETPTFNKRSRCRCTIL